MLKFLRSLGLPLFLLASVPISVVTSIPALASGLSPIGLAIVPPIQFPSEDVGITGARMSLLWGSHRNVHGIDIGVIGNITTQKFGGLAIAGLFNWNDGYSTIVGAQIAGLANINKNKVGALGLQFALGLNSNQAESTLIGLQIAAIGNFSEHTTIGGLQVGLYNSARVVYGFQVGLVNVAEELHGLQIGLVNIHKLGLFKVVPVINFGF